MSKKNIFAGIAFALTGLTATVASIDYGISAYEHFEKGKTQTYIQDYNPDYNTSIANGVISLTMGTSAIGLYCFSKRNLSKK